MNNGDRLDETCRKIAELRCQSSQCLRPFVVAAVCIAGTIAVINVLWPRVILDLPLMPHPWWCFVPCVFFARRYGGDLAGWLAVVAGCVYLLLCEPGSAEPTGLRMLTLLFLVGSGPRSWTALPNPFFLIGSIKPAAKRSAGGTQLDSLAHRAE